MEKELKCVRCGQCCKETTQRIDLPNVKCAKQYFKVGVSLPIDLEVMNASISTQGYCKHLKYSKDGIAQCQIYDKRPNICRYYECWRHLGTAVKFLRIQNFLAKNCLDCKNEKEVLNKTQSIYKYFIGLVSKKGGKYMKRDILLGDES